MEHLLNRHTVLARPGVGTLILVARRWSPNTVAQVWFQPEGARSSHPVPEHAWETVLASGSFEEVMAAIRATPPNP